MAAVTERGGQRRSRLHLVVHLLVVIFLADVVKNGNISSILLHLVSRRIGKLMKDGIDLAIGLREMSHQEVRVGIIVVIENSSLEVCFIVSSVLENRIKPGLYYQMDILLLHLLMIVVMGLVYLTEM